MITLNEAQRRAVTAGDGPALVLAGAGSGKTRVIVERLVWLIEERGIDQRNLLAVTFTNKAAAEMKKRMAQRLGVERVASWVGTFHSFGAFVLRREIDKLGRPKTFTIFDDTDQLSLMKRLVKGLPPGYEMVTPREALHWISLLKQELEEPDAAAPCATPEDETCRALWTRYHEALFNAQAVDFDDLLVLVARLLDDHPDVREKYQRRFRHVLVDEYQDTNRAQYWIAKRLTESHANLFVVGDEDQSIYSWRGANLRNIIDFDKDFPDARVFRLEQNYRSTTAILEVANAVVAHNEDRLGKNLWTAKEGGEQVRFHLAEDAEGEARFVVDDIAQSGISPRQVAVLYRTNAQARVLEEAFLRKGIAYVVVGGVRFYSRKEIKDLLCYFRLLLNPDDDESLRRVMNVPPRGVGAATMQRFEEYASSRGLSLFQTLREAEQAQTLSPRAQKAAGAVVSLIDDLTLEAKTSSVAELAESLLEKTEYRDYVRKSDEKDFRSRLEIVEEFVAACLEFDERDSGGVLEFLQELSLVSDVDGWDPDLPAATLMTCHSVKGLEFDCVYLAGLEEGLLPHAAAFESETEIEEERRLCYVAMTRAREKLTLSAAEWRVVYNERKDRKLSRFVHEIPRNRLVLSRWDEAAPSRTPKPRPAVEAAQLKSGTRVRHPKFGPGYVQFTSGSGRNLKARIRFETGRGGTFLIRATPLEIIDAEKG